MNRAFVIMFLIIGTLTACKKQPAPNSAAIISTPHNWQAISSPVAGNNGDIHFTSKDTGYIFGNLGKNYILRSVNAGSTWQILFNFTTSYPAFNCFYPVNTKTMFAARDSLYQSIAGGASWMKPTPGQAPSRNNSFSQIAIQGSS